MERTNKNNSRKLTDFLRYHKNEMSGEERNSHERDLQKDPFMEEASDGFSQITTDEAEKDLSAIKRRLEKRIRKRSAAVYYRLAAAVAVLVTISVILFNNRNMNNGITLGENNIDEVKVPVTIAASEPLKDKTESPALTLSPSPTPPVRVKAEEKETADEVTYKDEILSDQMIAADSVSLKNDLIAASAFAMDDEKRAKEEKKMENEKLAGFDLKEEAQIPLASRSKSASAFFNPEPVTGLDNFNIWIEKNIRNPEPDNNIQEEVVISFIVKKDSTLTNIKIISSPGMAFSSEAKRLIKEGPLWKPAMIEGKPIEEEYRFTILFR